MWNVGILESTCHSASQMWLTGLEDLLEQSGMHFWSNRTTRRPLMKCFPYLHEHIHGLYLFTLTKSCAGFSLMCLRRISMHIMYVSMVRPISGCHKPAFILTVTIISRHNCILLWGEELWSAVVSRGHVALSDSSFGWLATRERVLEEA